MSYMDDPSINRYESLLDMLRAFKVGDTFHDQLFALHGPVEIKMDSGRTSMECLACQVAWPCHTFRILEAWGRNEAKSQPIKPVKTAEDFITRVQEIAQENVDAEVVRSAIENAAVGNEVNPIFKQHMYERDFLNPGNYYCAKCQLPWDSRTHIQPEGAVKEADQGRADNVQPHVFEPYDDDSTSCQICHLPLSNQRHKFPSISDYDESLIHIMPHVYKSSVGRPWVSGDPCMICRMTYREGRVKGLHIEARVGETTETEDKS